MIKKRAQPYSIFIILLLLFHLIVFSIIRNRLLSFWINYGFTVVAFFIQLIIWEFTLGKNKSLKSKFLGFPIIYIGLVYFFIQLLLFIVFSLFPNISPLVPLILSSVVLGVAGISLATAQIGKNEVSRIEERVYQKRSFISELQTEVELLARLQTVDINKIALEKLAENIRFSDPMSTKSLAMIDEEIRSGVEALENTKSTEMINAVNEIETMIVRRNRLIITSK